jgi:ABC-type branched-subunit amino acid transport system ATPase component
MPGLVLSFRSLLADVDEHASTLVSLQARELVRDAALTSQPIAPVIDELAAGLGRQMLHASMPTLADACQVAAASVVALLLQVRGVLGVQRCQA